MSAGRAREVTLLGIAGTAFAGLTWSTVGLGLPALVVGGLNGVIGGARGTYSRDRLGAAAFVLDSSWALATTTAALGVHLIDTVGGAGYVAESSRRRNRHVYRGGFTPRRGYAVTVGNVISAAGDTSTESRRRLVDEHEETHVWQTRILGPFFAPLYLGWSVLGAAAAVPRWLATARPRPRFTAVVDSLAYRRNPLERWAERRPVGFGTSGLGVDRAEAVSPPAR